MRIITKNIEFFDQGGPFQSGSGLVKKLKGLGAANHDFSGFNESDGCVARLQGQFADCIGGDNRRNPLIANGDNDLGQQAFDGDFEYRTEQLIPSADSAAAGAGSRSGQELLERIEGNAVVPAGSLDGPNAPSQNPVLEHGVADAEFLRRLARCEKRR
jgi:hypothetical protein